MTENTRHETPDRTELRRRLDALPGFALKHLNSGPGGEPFIALADEGGMPLSESDFDAVLLFAEIAALEVPRLLDQLDAADAALARARKLHDNWMEQANFNSEQWGDFWRGMTVKGQDCADGLRLALDGGEQS